MEKSIFDLTVDELVSRQKLVKSELHKRFKKTKPFRMEPVSDEELLYEYNTKGYEVFSNIARAKGMDAAIEYRDKMEQIKARRNK